MKNQLIVYSVIIGLTSCTAMRRSTTSATTAPAAKSTTSSQTTKPVFLEHISIKADNTQSSSKKSIQQPAFLMASEGNIIPPIGVEMLLPQQFKYAILLDVPVEEIVNNKLIEYIDSWYGTPYRYGGSDKTGVDCSSFVQSFMQYIYGISLPRISAEQYKQSKRISRSELAEGDLVFFITRGKRIGISHVGVYLCNNKFVHASTTGGVMISDLEEPYYHKHYSGGGRVKEFVVSK